MCARGATMCGTFLIALSTFSFDFGVQHPPSPPDVEVVPDAPAQAAGENRSTMPCFVCTAACPLAGGLSAARALIMP